jgi:hypothetical protein
MDTQNTTSLLPLPALFARVLTGLLLELDPVDDMYLEDE